MTEQDEAVRLPGPDWTHCPGCGWAVHNSATGWRGHLCPATPPPAAPAPKQPTKDPGPILSEKGTSMARSNAETLLAVQLEQAGIPFEREYRFHPERKWRADFALSERLEWCYECGGSGILIEIDGGAYVQGRHSRGTGVEADCEKTSAAAILGYRVIRVTPKQVEDGRALSWIRQALGMEVAA